MVNNNRLLETFLDLVRIDSPSGEEEAVALEVARRLEALGAKTTRDGFGNLIAKLAGRGEALLVGAHLDTVEPGRAIKPVIDGDVIRTDGTTVLGGDPKAGVAAIIEALTVLTESGARHPALELVFTRQEESGLEGSKNLDYSLLSARSGVEFDGEGAVSNVTVAAPARVRIEVMFTGRAAHAGVEPEKGLSAVQMAAMFVAGFPQGRLDAETTANIGQIEGGSAVNAVPETARIHAEMRSRNPTRLAALADEVRALAATVEAAFMGGKVAVGLGQEFGSYRLEASHPVVRRATDALVRIGLAPNLIASGGATDANNFALRGIEVVVVGLGGADFHTVRESLPVANLVDAARFCVAFLGSGPA